MPPKWFGDSLWIYMLAQVLVLWYMLLTGTVHPPTGANPIIMIHGHFRLSALWQPVFVGVLGLAVVAALWSRLYPGAGRRYVLSQNSFLSIDSNHCRFIKRWPNAPCSGMLTQNPACAAPDSRKELSRPTSSCNGKPQQ
ncbi:MAG: HPP family protein [Nitrosospira sp.]